MALETNGWRRLWVGASALLIFPALLVGYESRPTEEALYRAWSTELLALSANNDPALAGKRPRELAAAFANFPPKKLVEKYEANYLAKHPDLQGRAKELARPFKKRLDRLYLYMAVHAALTVLVWALACGVVYSSGLAPERLRGMSPYACGALLEALAVAMMYLVARGHNPLAQGSHGLAVVLGALMFFSLASAAIVGYHKVRRLLALPKVLAPLLLVMPLLSRPNKDPYFSMIFLMTQVPCALLGGAVGSLLGSRKRD
jgi:hypothetical protein